MAPGGVMVTQNGVPFLQPDELISSVGMFKACSRMAPATSPRSRPMWAATWRWAGPRRTKSCASILRTIATRYKKARSFKTRYWTPEVHVAAFALPRFIAEHVKAAKRKQRRRYSTFPPNSFLPHLPCAMRRAWSSRQLREPLAIALHDRVVGEPALVDPGIGAEQEALRVAREQRTPVGRQLAAASVMPPR